jgi:hypothetical protein
MPGPIGRNTSYGVGAVVACVVLLTATAISLSGKDTKARQSSMVS